MKTGYFWQTCWRAQDWCKNYAASHNDADLLVIGESQDALIRRFQVIGEAASQVSKALRGEHPELPGSRIIALRNILVHDYYEIDIARLINTARQEIPALIVQLERLLAVLGRSI